MRGRAGERRAGVMVGLVFGADGGRRQIVGGSGIRGERGRKRLNWKFKKL